MIETALKKDLGLIAICHMNAFPDSFSTKLGQKYCIKMLEWYLSSDKTFLFHLKIEDKVVGYCGGKVEGALGSGSSTAMMQYSFNQAIYSMILRPWLFFNKTMIANYVIILKNILLKFNIKKKKVSTADKKEINTTISIGLVVIGVNNQYKGLGYGSKLLIEFEKRSKSMNAKSIYLSVKTANLSAIRSYSRNGWIVKRSDNLETKMYKLI